MNQGNQSNRDNRPEGVIVPEATGGAGGTARGGHTGSNVAPIGLMEESRQPAFDAKRTGAFGTDGSRPGEVVYRRTIFNDKTFIGRVIMVASVAGAFALVLKEAIQSIRARRSSSALSESRVASTRGPAPGRPWNVNLDPRESGMAV